MIYGYYCVVCGRHLEADEYGVIVHDDVPHPVDMEFDEVNDSKKAQRIFTSIGSAVEARKVFNSKDESKKPLHGKENRVKLG